MADIDDILARINAMPDANSGDPVADEFTWEDAAANTPMPGEMAPPPSSTPTQQPAMVSGKTTDKVSVGTTFSGVTDAGRAQAAKVMGPADRRAEARMAEEKAFTQDSLAKNQANYAAVGTSYEDAIRATQEFQEFDAQYRQQEIDFNKGAAELEARLAGEAQADRAQYVGAYKEQLAVVRQLALQSGNPMNRLSQGEAIGLAGAQFAQGFLAAQGINIDVAGQVDRWVERSIQEHQNKIQNARATAEDQLHLYELSRQNSQDEWEARQRYRGFVIAGLQSSIGLNASRFQSDIAMSRAHEQIARLQIDADTTERAIADKYFERRTQIYGQEFGRARDMGQLAIQKQGMEVEMLKARAAAIKAQADADKEKAAAVPPDFVVPDVEYATDAAGKELVDPTTGSKTLQNRWRVNKNVMKDDVLARKVWGEASEHRQNFADYDDTTKDMIKFYAAAKKVRDEAGILGGKPSWEALSRIDESGAVQAFIQARNNWAQKRVLVMSGKAATDKEQERIIAQAYADKFLATNGTKGEESHAQLRKEGIRSFTRQMESLGMEEIPETDPARIGKSVPAAPRTMAQTEATLTGVKAEPGVASVLEGQTTDRGSNEVVTTEPSGTWADYQRDVQIPNSDRSDKIPLGQPEYATRVDQLVAAYARPHYIRTKPPAGVKIEKDETPAEIRREAYEALTRLANTAPGDVREYAMYQLEKLDADPVLAPLKDQKYDERLLGQDAEDIEDSPLIQAMQPRKRK